MCIGKEVLGQVRLSEKSQAETICCLFTKNIQLEGTVIRWLLVFIERPWIILHFVTHREIHEEAVPAPPNTPRKSTSLTKYRPEPSCQQYPSLLCKNPVHMAGVVGTSTYYIIN
jgi:hypothetical protein